MKAFIGFACRAARPLLRFELSSANALPSTPVDAVRSELGRRACACIGCIRFTGTLYDSFLYGSLLPDGDSHKLPIDERVIVQDGTCLFRMDELAKVVGLFALIVLIGGGGISELMVGILELVVVRDEFRVVAIVWLVDGLIVGLIDELIDGLMVVGIKDELSVWPIGELIVLFVDNCGSDVDGIGAVGGRPCSRL